MSPLPDGGREPAPCRRYGPASSGPAEINGPTGTWRTGAALVLLSIVVLGAGLGMRCPWTPGESALAQAGSEMLAGGPWLQPTVGGLPVSLPLLPVWLQALAQALTGSTCSGFLLPALLAALATLVLTWDLARRVAGRGAGPGAWLLLLATPQFALAARDGSAGMIVTALMTFSLYGLLRHLLVRPDWRWLAAGSAAAGTGSLAGGPVWLALLALLPWGLARARGWPVPAVPLRRWWIGAGAFLVAAAVAALVSSTAGEGAPAVPSRPVPDLWPTSAWTLLLWWLPATALLPWLLPLWGAALDRREPLVVVLGGWLVLAALPLGLWGGDFGPAALLPALPAVAVLASAWLTPLIQRRAIRRLALVLALLVPAGLVAYALWPPEPLQQALDTGEPFAWPFVRWSVLLGLGAALLFRQPRAVTALIVVYCGTGMLLALLGRPALDPYRSGREIMDLASLIAPDTQPLGLMDPDPRWFVTTPRSVAHFGDGATRAGRQRRALTWLAGNPDRRLLAAGAADECFDPEQATLLGAIRGRSWYLVSPADAQKRCGPSAPVESAGPIVWRPAAPRTPGAIP